jgi:DNA-binding LacI/PurR family transcriptional regulator
MPATLNEIAKAAGVSVSTVSRVMNHTSHTISEETRTRVLQIAEVMGYRPNQMARGLRAQHSQICGIIVDNIDSNFAPPIVRGIQDRLKDDQYSITILNSDFDQGTEQSAIHTLLSFPVDGIIFVDTWLHAQPVDIPFSGKPAVFVNRIFPEGEGLDFIGPDDYYGAQLAVDHLLRLGHRRIAYINGPKDWKASGERLHGYRDSLLQAGISFDPDLVQVGDWNIGTGYQAAKVLLGLPNRPTAIFAGNDSMAIGVVYATQDLRLRIPHDLALVGFDNSNMSTVVRPALTTVTMPVYEMGRAAADMFLARMDPGVLYSGSRKIRGRLVVRESCGGVPTAEVDPLAASWNRFTHIHRMETSGEIHQNGETET